MSKVNNNQLYVRLKDPSLKGELKILAIKKSCTQEELVEKIIKEYLDNINQNYHKDDSTTVV